MPKYDPGVYIAIPNYRGVLVQGLAGWLFSVEGSTGEKIMLDMHSQQPVDACRNKLVTRFLKKSNLEWMLFIDDDIVPWPLCSDAHRARLNRECSDGASLVNSNQRAENVDWLRVPIVLF